RSPTSVRRYLPRLRSGLL
ncbi:type VI secretion-associated protein, partial [Vibrio parahaemolyticus IDH02640]